MYLCLNRGTAGGGLDAREFAHLASRAGFAGADVDMQFGVDNGPAALGELFASLNLKFGGWGPGDWRGEESAWRECLQKLDRQAAVARELGVDSCCTWIMPSADRPLRENFDFHVTRLSAVCKVLADHGLRFGLEFVAPYHLRRHFKHEFLFSPGQMLELADACGPNCGLLVDVFHVFAAGESFEFLASLPKDKIVLVHLNDCPQRDLTKIKDGERVLPGEGVIDIAAFIAAVRNTGYSGPVSLEVFNADLKAMDPLAAAKRARAAGAKFM